MIVSLWLQLTAKRIAWCSTENQKYFAIILGLGNMFLGRSVNYVENINDPQI